MNFGINTSVPRNFIKEAIVMIACFFFYAFLIIFMFTPAGATFFETLKTWLPFDELIEGTFSDINRFLGLIFESIQTNSVAGDVVVEAYSLSLAAIFLDLCKLMLASFIQNMLFLLFSWCFLYSSVFTSLSGVGETSIGSILDGLTGKKDLIYYINHALLMGISVLLGGFLGSYIMTLIEKAIIKITASQPNPNNGVHIISFVLFLVFLILFIVYYMLKSRKIMHVAISFIRALTKVIAYDIIPEFLTIMVTNIIIVFLFHSAVNYGFHIVTIITFGVFLFWLCLENMVSSLAKELFVKNLPYCGKNCPYTGLLWLPATISSVMLLYVASLTEFTNNGATPYLKELPLIEEWFKGANPGSVVINNFPSVSNILINLVFICTLAAVLQYVSSSFTGMVYTQIVGRIFIILGAQMAILFLVYALFSKFFPFFVDFMGYPNVLAFIVLILYLFFFILQPHLAIQGILTAVGVVLIQSFLPVSAFWNTGNAEKDIVSFIFVAIILIVLNIVFSLAQNIVAIIEKKINRAKMATEIVVETITN